MYTHNLDPVLLNLGPIEIRYYGLVYVIGFLLVYWTLNKAVENKSLKNMDKKGIDDFIFWEIIGVVIGARLGFFLFYHLGELLSSPLDLFKIWQGGMSFHGGLIGACVVLYWFVNKHNISFYRLADILVIPIAFALGLGRLANFVNGELIGLKSNVSWCVNFPNAEGCRHPAQIYLALKNFVVVGILYYLNQRKLKESVLFWNFIFWYGLGRFFIDFLRVESSYFGISIGQCLTLIMVIVGAYMLKKQR